MPKGGRELTDADLLGGEDDDQMDDTTVAGLDDLTDADDDLAADLTADRSDKQDAKDDDIDVVIVDQDEGRETQRQAEAEEDTGRGEYDQDQDTGEELGEDLLTADERKAYSKTVQKRIQRERRLKIEERAGREAAEAQAAKLAGELLESQKGFAAVLSAHLGVQVAAKMAALEQATEDGKTKESIQLQSELNDLQAQKREADAMKERLEKAEPAKPAQSANPVAERWKARNPFFDNPKFAAQKAAVLAIDAGLGAEFKAGRFRFGPNSAEYFVELDRRIHREMPALRTQVRNEYGGGGQRTRTQVASVSRSAAPRRTATVAKGRVELTRADLENMQNFGLDTKDPKVLKEYARNKSGGSLNG